MNIVSKVMEKSWKSHGNLLVKMCTNPVILTLKCFKWVTVCFAVATPVVLEADH